MAKTIEQIQQIITDKALDERQIINLMMDYLQFNFGEGATATISSSTSLQESIDSGATLDKDNDIHTGTSIFKITAGTPDFSGVSAQLKVQEGGIYLYSQNADGTGYVNLVIAHGNGSALLETGNSSGKLVALNISDNYADDTAASNGGIAVGAFYHTNGTLKVRLV